VDRPSTIGHRSKTLPRSATVRRQPHLPFSGQKKRVAEAQAMSQPAKRIPQWLTIDLLVIVLSLAIIGIFIAID
jgi:hypothetical protein